MEVKITDDVEYLPIEDSSVWVNRIILLKNYERNVVEAPAKIVKLGFEISKQVEQIQNQYIEMVRNV